MKKDIKLDENETNRPIDSSEKKNSDINNSTTKEIEIENGFFSVDDTQTEKEATSDEEFTASPDENNLYTETQVDTIDAAFNGALGISKGNSFNRTSVSPEPSPEERDSEISKDFIENNNAI